MAEQSMKHDLYRQTIGDKLTDIIKGDSKQTERDVREKLWAWAAPQQSVFRLLFDNWFNANYRRLIIMEGQHSIAVFRPSIGTERVQFDKLAAARAAARRERKIGALVGSAMEHLVATAMHMTFGECARAGGRFTALARLGKPNERVGAKLTEQQVRNVWFRNQ